MVNNLDYVNGDYVLQDREVNERFSATSDFTDLLGS